MTLEELRTKYNSILEKRLKMDRSTVETITLRDKEKTLYYTMSGLWVRKFGHDRPEGFYEFLKTGIIH